MRAMRLKKREVTDKKVLGEILEECDVVRIGAVDEEGMFIVPVNFGYDFDTGEETTRLVLYFHGAAEGRKVEAFALNPDVAVEMDCCHELITGNYTCSYSYAYRSIMGKGRVSRITSDEEKQYALSRIMEHAAPDAGIVFRREMLDRTAVFRIDVVHFTGKERKKKG